MIRTKQIARPAKECKVTSTFVEPEGEGWKYDGGGTDVVTGEREHFWIRVRPNMYTDYVYTLKPGKIPAGEGWGHAYVHISGSTEQRRYVWSRTYELHPNGSRTYETQET